MRMLLACPPRHFEVAYRINPWMTGTVSVDRRLAGRQWDALMGLLTLRCGVRVEEVRPAKGQPDMTFAANCGFARARAFVPARFRHRERRGETPHFVRHFRAAGWSVTALPGQGSFEGEGDIQALDGRLFAGHGFRSALASHHALERLTGLPVVPLKLVDPRYYHLDTCFCPLGRETALYYPPAFDRPARRTLLKEVSRLLAVTDAEAEAFACNSIALDGKVVLGKGLGELRRRLEKEGFETFETDLSEFKKAGGGPRCLVLYLHS